MPVGDRTCAQQRLDLTGAREGSCWQDGRRITVANAGTVLQTSALRAKLEGASTRQVLPRAESFLEPERARGRFVVARVTVTNQTTRPVNSVRSSLVIGQNTYAESSAGFRYGDRDIYPLQPGGSATLTLLYDIPQDAARTALQQGAVELPGSTLDGGGLFDRDEVGRIRLAGAPSAKLAGARSDD
ncbi:DUF4352 domain-containing protein [Paraconexibacter algicola]|uniref:DUF4352 domain-containing protein n=1 Tax=Paraconexibacter algicola TaxID=2133960 RepID=A0A2T4UM72_9ACTN|nr:DUF4352 domain-containing protein [Paraconexibacter algicola]PTL60346.1 hypothetical protein C7Y72_12210 [Paraconexibacter algicola]